MSNYGLFYGCKSLESYKISKFVQHFGYCSFYGCEKLKEIIIPDIIESIGKQCFYGCISLNKIEIPDSVRFIESDAFGQCDSLKKIKIPRFLVLNTGFFKNTHIETIIVPKDSLVRIYPPKNVSVVYC